jgi:hypothetical protein
VAFVTPRVATPKVSIWIGWDPREAAAFAVARASVEKYALRCWPVRGVVLSKLQAAGLYRRPIAMHPGVDREIMWDVLSDAPMSTEHANARFLVPHLARQGWALFMDGDMLVRSELGPMFNSLDPQFAVYCVKHRFDPPDGVKMDGQAQSRYARKNWSSFLRLERAGTRPTRPLRSTWSIPGRAATCTPSSGWLEDELIGELGPEWNFLVGHTDPSIEPKCIHWTSGVPDMRGYENVAFAAEWREARDAWAQGQLNLGAG